jgi:hypothetical protein
MLFIVKASVSIVPSTSMSPEMSRLAKTEVPVAVTVPVTSMPVAVVSNFLSRCGKDLKNHQQRLRSNRYRHRLL